jgi:O-antigen ligase
MATISTHPARLRTPILSSQVPLIVGGLAAALLVGVLLARDISSGIGALLGLLYVPVIMLNLPLGVALYVPFGFVGRLPAASIGPTVASILVLLAWLGTLPARHSIVWATLRRTPGLFICLLLLVVWVTMSITWAVDSSAASGEFIDWWVSAGVLLIIGTSFTQRRYAVILCAAFVGGALISVVAGLLPGAAVATSGLPGEASRFSGSFGDPNFLAAGLVPAIALTVGLAAVYRSGGQRIALLGVAAILAIGLAASGSRGGIVAAAVSAAGALLVARGRRLSIVAIVVGGLAVAGLWFATSSPSTWDRVREFDTGTGRADLWEVAWRMSKAHPVAGVGLDGYTQESAEFVRQPGGRLPTGPDFTRAILNEPLVAHNTYLQLLAETGAVGLSLLALLILAATRASWLASRAFERLRDPPMVALSRAAVIAQIGAASAMIFISDYYDKRFWILLGLGPALLAVAAHSERTALDR